VVNPDMADLATAEVPDGQQPGPQQVSITVAVS
jgi:hypothetical protein